MDRYKGICIENKIVEESSQTTLVDFLNDLGVIIHFKDFELENTHVLNPRWVTTNLNRLYVWAGDPKEGCRDTVLCGT